MKANTDPFLQFNDKNRLIACESLGSQAKAQCAFEEAVQ